MVPETLLKDILFWTLDNNKSTNAGNNQLKDNVLHYACKKGYLPVVKMLVEDRKMSLHEPGLNNLTAAQMALESRDKELLKYMAKSGVKFNTPINWLTQLLDGSNASFGKFLCEANLINMNTKKFGGNTMLHQIVNQILVENKPSDTNTAKLLLENGACPSINDSQGKSPLDLAFELNNTPMVKMIFNYLGNHKTISGPECVCPKEKLAFDTKTTRYLLEAVKNDNTEIVNILIGKGTVNLNVQDPETKKAPIHLANEKVAGFLIANGADIDIQDKNYETSLHMAARNGNKELALILIRNGANAELENEGGKTAQEIANQNQNFDIAEMIIREKTMKKIKQKFNIVSKSNPFKSIDLDFGNTFDANDGKRADGQKECVICFAPKNGTFSFVPCGHAKTCEKCTKAVADSKKPAHERMCPICRTPVNSFMKIIT